MDGLGKSSKTERQFNLEEEYKQTMERLGSLDDYKLVAIPKPDGDTLKAYENAKQKYLVPKEYNIKQMDK